MVFQCELAVGFLELIIRGGLIDPENHVIVFSHGCSCLAFECGSEGIWVSSERGCRAEIHKERICVKTEEGRVGED